MRTIFGLALATVLCATSSLVAQPLAPYSSPEGHFKVRFGGAPKITTKTSETDVGELTVTIATFANSDGSILLVSYTDFPSAPKAETLPKLFAGVRDAVKGNGKQIEDKEYAFGPENLPGREFVVDKGKQRIRLRTWENVRIEGREVLGQVPYHPGGASEDRRRPDTQPL
jgi:hypothetical protein